MFRLKATLVARTVLRPWRTGWSVDRGVDFLLPARAGTVIDPGARRDEPIGAERACFIDEDWTVPPATMAWRRGVGPAPDVAPETGCSEVSGPASLRAWWSLSGKPPQT